MPNPDDGSHDDDILNATVLMNFEKTDGGMHNPSWLGTIVEQMPDGRGKIITHNHYEDLRTDYYMFARSDGQFWRKIEASKVDDELASGLSQTREIIVPKNIMNNYYSPKGHLTPMPLGTPLPGGMASSADLSAGDPAAVAYLAPPGRGGDHAEVFHGNVWGIRDDEGTSAAFVASGANPDFAGSGDSGGGLFVRGKHYGNAWRMGTSPYYGQYGWILALNG